MHRTMSWIVMAALAVGGIGCRHTCCRKAPACAPPPPPLGAPLIQPQPVTPAPGPGAGTEVLPPAAPPPGVSAAPSPAPAAPSGYGPVAQANEAIPAIHLLQPELGESVQQAAASEPPAVAESKSAPPPASAPAPSAPSPTLPVGIPGFASAITDKVASGRKPTLEGLDWLKTNGYHGALMLRKPGESEAADRRQFEQRGIAFSSLEVALTSLDRSTVEQFNHAVADASRRPLFVYDTDGSLAGPLWYLYFRRVEHIDDDAARAKAERLGLRLDDRDQRLGWLAVQDFLAKNP